MSEEISNNLEEFFNSLDVNKLDMSELIKETNSMREKMSESESTMKENEDLMDEINSILIQEKEVCENLKNGIKSKHELLATAERDVLQPLINKIEDLKDAQKKLSIELEEKSKRLTQLKKLRKPSSRDTQAIQQQRDLLRTYENIFKMKVFDPAFDTTLSGETPATPKNFVRGIIYNRNSVHLKQFTVPQEEGTGWPILSTAGHIEWTLDCDNDDSAEIN